MGADLSPPPPRFVAPLFHSRLISSLPFRRYSAWMGRSTRLALLNPRRQSLAWLCAPQFHSALLHHHQHSPCPPCTPHQALLLCWWRTSFSPEFILLPFQTPFWFTTSYPLILNLLDITNQGKPHWNSILSTRLARIILKYMECRQLLSAVDESCVPAFVGPDEMGDLVDDIEPMFNWYHSIA